MKSSTNLREAFFLFVMLVIMALFNTGQLWEARRLSMHYTQLELTQLLGLDKMQLERIHNIHALYESRLSHVILDAQKFHEEKFVELLRERDRQIMEVLNDDQQKILYKYCTNMISTEMVE